jgi:DNA-binding response OmpR family regulator
MKCHRTGLIRFEEEAMIPNIRTVRGLIVEGDPETRTQLRDYLQTVVHYEALVVNAPFHLLAICETLAERPTVILLDMEWSRVEGPALVQEVKSLAPWISILGMTTRPSQLYGHPIIRRHSIGLIQKPFSPYQLHRNLKAVLAADGWLTHAWIASPMLRDLVSIHLSGNLA